VNGRPSTAHAAAFSIGAKAESLLSLAKCHEILGGDSRESDADLVRLRNQIYGLARLAVEAFSGERREKRSRQAPNSPRRVFRGGPKRQIWRTEQCFASPQIQQRLRDMQGESAIVLDTESKEKVLVGEVISTVARAAQISREINMSDHGIDMEIEFKNDRYEATGQKLYLQLKSGDSHLRERRRDGAKMFTIKDERHARYWMAQAFPVLLVIRNSEG
jgi:hypothetical protein